MSPANYFWRMRCYVGLGSNLGDREAALDSGVRALALRWGPASAVSPLYETAAWGMPAGTPAFLNAVASFELAPSFDRALGPLALLDDALEIETAHGRQRASSAGPGAPRYLSRTLDIDLLLIDGIPFSHPRLTLPHPELMNRRFVLQPLCDIAPDLQMPGHGLTFAQCLHRLERTRPADDEITVRVHRH